MTQPDEAAAIIHRGVEAGKARILVGPDARLFDIVTRIAPTHYYGIVRRIQSQVASRRARASARRADVP